jgi:hypothetical protein
MRRKGLIRARQFSWAQSVEKTLDVYRGVARK